MAPLQKIHNILVAIVKGRENRRRKEARGREGGFSQKSTMFVALFIQRDLQIKVCNKILLGYMPNLHVLLKYLFLGSNKFIQIVCMFYFLIKSFSFYALKVCNLSI